MSGRYYCATNCGRRAKEVVDPNHAADLTHKDWPGRGLFAADNAFREWITLLPPT